MSDANHAGSDDEGADRLTYRAWVDALQDGFLLGQRCRECGNETATPKAACNDCGSRRLETVDLATTGTVYTETTIAVAPAKFEGEYRIAVVDLADSNTRITARLEGDAEIGDTVELSGVLEVDEPVPVFA